MKTAGLIRRVAAAVVLIPAVLAQHSFAWGHDAHSMINRLAVATLPTDTPEFLRSYAAMDTMSYYGPQPDRWRSEDKSLYGSLVPEHDIDLEWADLAGPLPRTRYEYIQALAVAQAKHPELKLGPGNVGLLPYSTNETYTMLKSAMRDYRGLLAARQDTRPVEAEILFLAGLLGHYVGDGSQPLHATINYNGWTGPNPNGYAADHTIHARFEGDYVHNNIKSDEVAALITAKPVVINDPFSEFVTYVRQSNSLVEKVYELDKTGAFTGAGTPQGRAFVDERIASGATELRNMIYTAWVKSGIPIPQYKGN